VNQLLETMAAFGLTFAVHGALLMALALGCGLLLRHRGLCWQESLCRLALWGGLCSSLLQWFLCGGPLPGVPAVGAAAIGIGPDEVPSVPLSAAPVAAASDLSSAGLACVLAAAMGLLGVAWHLRLRSGQRRLLSARRPETSARVLAAAAAAADALGLQQAPRLSRCPGLGSPVAFGWVLPEICLPARACELDDDELRAMLAHELAHLKRRDPLWLHLGAMLQALFPWQPLLLPLRRRLSHLAELRCDAVAAGCTGPVPVARCLVQVAGWLGEGRRALPAQALAMAARPSLLRVRVAAALQGRADRRLPRPLAIVAALSLLSLLTAAGPGTRASGPAALPAPEDRVAAGGRSVLAERAVLLREAADLRQRARAVPGDRELQRLLGQLESRLAALRNTGDRLDAALARRDDVSSH
jgi:Zn-dependent protease with chaperone function